MKKFGKFAISLAAAGYIPTQAEPSAILPQPFTSLGSDGAMFQIFRGDHKFSLAANRSHSSHASHGSHRSSSGGGGYSTIPRSYSSPPSSVMPKVPSAPRAVPAFQKVVMDVQLALFIAGYYTGPIDGVVGADTRAAISKFQSDWNLPITGTITPELLDALKIVAQ